MMSLKYASEKGLDASIRGTKTVSKQLIFLVVITQERPGDFESMPIRSAVAEGLPESGQFQIDIAE